MLHEICRPSYTALIEKCTGLLELHLTFRPDDLRRGFHGPLWRLTEYPRRINADDLSLLVVEYVVQKYALRSLLELKRLQRVEVVVRHARVAARDANHQMRDTAPDQLMDKVCNWLREAISQKFMAVPVVLRSTRQALRKDVL